jgi:hypothetical protein
MACTVFASIFLDEEKCHSKCSSRWFWIEGRSRGKIMYFTGSKSKLHLNLMWFLFDIVDIQVGVAYICGATAL